MSSSTEPEVRIIPAGEFKAKCLQLMDEVNEGKLTLIVTKRGKPVSQVTAPANGEQAAFRPLWGRTPNVRVLGDIMKPLDWPELRRNGSACISGTKPGDFLPA